MKAEKTAEQIAINNIVNFYREFDSYANPDDYMDEWKNLVYENPVKAYNYLEDSRNAVLECEDDDLIEMFDNTLNSVYECILCNEEVL